jgi:hypothetical protein
MLKRLLYLYNDGHNPFPKLNSGGLGYHLPQYRKRMHGEALHIFTNDDGEHEVIDDGNDDDPTWYTTDPRVSSIAAPETRDRDEVLFEADENKTEKESKKKIDDEEEEYIKDVIHNLEGFLNVYDKKTKKYDNEEESKEENEVLGETKEGEIEPVDITPINNYVKNWRNAGENKKRMTNELTSLYNFTDEQKRLITNYRINNKIEEFKEWMTTQAFELKEHEIIEGETEGFIPEYETIQFSQDKIDEVKLSELITDDNVNDIDEEDLTNIVQYQTSLSPFQHFLGEEQYNLLRRTYPVEEVKDLLYDTESGEYDSGKDLEDKVLKNLDLVKEILISTYGRDRVDLDSIIIEYDASETAGDLFTVFDAHAVNFKFRNTPSEPYHDKSSFIEFKKYSNYSKAISDTNVILKNEEENFNKFMYLKLKEINNLNDELSFAKESEYSNKKINEIINKLQNKSKELNEYNRSNLMKEFYQSIDPIGIGVKYTKFPPLPKNTIRSESSVNSKEAYDRMKQYENTSSRKKANIQTHEKAKTEDIDILVVTGLKNSLVVANVSELMKSYGNKEPIEYLKLKPTVYGTKQKGTTTKSYDHYNIPFSYFKNVNLRPIKNPNPNLKVQTSELIHNINFGNWFNMPKPSKETKETEKELSEKLGLKNPNKKEKKPKK